jgi:hypothetical protein
MEIMFDIFEIKGCQIFECCSGDILIGFPLLQGDNGGRQSTAGQEMEGQDSQGKNSDN